MAGHSPEGSKQARISGPIIPDQVTARGFCRLLDVGISNLKNQT